MWFCFSPYSHRHVIGMLSRAGWPGLQTWAATSTGTPGCLPAKSRSGPKQSRGAVQSLRSPLLTPRSPCSTCGAAIPVCKGRVCTDTALCKHSPAPAPSQIGACTRCCIRDKSPPANSCSREQCRNQLYRYYQGLSIIWSVPAPLYLIKQSWLCC